MAVVTIDAKGELEALQAEADGQEPIKGEPTEPESANTPEKPAEKPEPDPEDVEGDDGLTPREKQDLLGAQRKDLPQSVHRVIAKRVAQRKAAEEFAAAQYNERQLAEQRTRALERELADLKAKAPPPAEVAGPDAGKPQRDKFDSDEKFWEAMTDWRVDQKLKAQAEQQAREAAERHQAEVTAAAKIRFDKAAKLVDDFEKTVRAIGETKLHEAVLGYMEQSDLMPEMLYYLGKNPDKLEALSKQVPAGQLVTIGKIESTLKPFAASKTDDAAKDPDGATPSSKTASTNGQRSQAAPGSDTGTIPSRARGTAPVIKPLNGSGATPSAMAPEDMNIRETIHDWEKKHNANLGLRRRH